MVFLHTHSCECLKSELELFTVPPTQATIESSQWIHYKPISSLTDNSSIEFVVPGQGEEYIDLPHTMLSIQISTVLAFK